MTNATFQNGNHEITATITGRNEWEAGDKARVYFYVEHTGKRTIIAKLYEVLTGGTRDNTITVDGRTFGYVLSGCDSNTKRKSAVAAVEELASQL